MINPIEDTPKNAEKITSKVNRWTNAFGNLFVSLFHRIALFGIGLLLYGQQ